MSRGDKSKTHDSIIGIVSLIFTWIAFGNYFLELGLFGRFDRLLVAIALVLGMFLYVHVRRRIARRSSHAAKREVDTEGV